MAPERFGPDPAGPAADVFAWAVVVAFAATGTTPFQLTNPDACAVVWTDVTATSAYQLIVRRDEVTLTASWRFADVTVR
jgi:hypothetical protein